MRIGALAAETATTTKTIRFYESLGLLNEPERTHAGYRDYEVDAVDRLRFIRQAQAAGFSLEEIGSILRIKDRGDASCARTRELLAQHLEMLDERIEELNRTRTTLSRLFDRSAELDPSTCNDPNSCQVIKPSLDS